MTLKSKRPEKTIRVIAYTTQPRGLWHKQITHMEVEEEYFDFLLHNARVTGNEHSIFAFGRFIHSVLVEGGHVWNCLEGWSLKRMPYVPY